MSYRITLPVELSHVTACQQGGGRYTRHTGLPLSYRITLPVALSHVTAWEGRGEADRSLSELTRDLKTGNGPLSHMEHR